MKLSSYKLNFDGWKHALGYLAAFATLWAPGLALHLVHGPTAPYVAAGSTLFCALVAFVCGAQSEAAFLKTETSALNSVGVPAEVTATVTKVTEQVVTTVTTPEKEDTKP